MQLKMKFCDCKSFRQDYLNFVSVFATYFSIQIQRAHPGMDDMQMRHQGHQTDTIEHMALTGLVAHRTNVIENMAMAHRANEMAMQQQQQQPHRGHPMEGMTTVINEYRKQ